MAEQVRQEFIRTFGRLNFVDLGAADRTVQNLHQHLAGVEFVRKFDLVDDERLARFHKDRRLRVLHLH